MNLFGNVNQKSPYEALLLLLLYEKLIFYTLTIILIVFYTFLISGLMGLIGNHGIGKDGNAHIMHHPGAALIILAVISGLTSQLYKYGDKIAGMQQVLAAMLGMVVMAFIVGDPDNYGGNKGLFDLAFLIFIVPVLLVLLFHPKKRELLSFDLHNANKQVLIILSVLLIPFFVYGVQQSLMQRNSFPPLSDIHHSHWHAMGTIAFATIFIGIVGAMRTKGYLLPLVVSSASLVVLGTLSVLNPTAPSSLGLLLGIVSLLGGLIVIWLLYRGYKYTKLNM